MCHKQLTEEQWDEVVDMLNEDLSLETEELSLLCLKMLTYMPPSVLLVAVNSGRISYDRHLNNMQNNSTNALRKALVESLHSILVSSQFSIKNKLFIEECWDFIVDKILSKHPTVSHAAFSAVNSLLGKVPELFTERKQHQKDRDVNQQNQKLAFAFSMSKLNSMVTGKGAATSAAAYNGQATRLEENPLEDAARHVIKRMVGSFPTVLERFAALEMPQKFTCIRPITCAAIELVRNTSVLNAAVDVKAMHIASPKMIVNHMVEHHLFPLLWCEDKALTFETGKHILLLAGSVLKERTWVITVLQAFLPFLQQDSLTPANTRMILEEIFNVLHLVGCNRMASYILKMIESLQKFKETEYRIRSLINMFSVFMTKLYAHTYLHDNMQECIGMIMVLLCDEKIMLIPADNFLKYEMVAAVSESCIRLFETPESDLIEPPYKSDQVKDMSVKVVIAYAVLHAFRPCLSWPVDKLAAPIVSYLRLLDMVCERTLRMKATVACMAPSDTDAQHFANQYYQKCLELLVMVLMNAQSIVDNDIFITFAYVLCKHVSQLDKKDSAAADERADGGKEAPTGGEDIPDVPTPLSPSAEEMRHMDVSSIPIKVFGLIESRFLEQLNSEDNLSDTGVLKTLGLPSVSAHTVKGMHLAMETLFMLGLTETSLRHQATYIFRTLAEKNSRDCAWSSRLLFLARMLQISQWTRVENLAQNPLASMDPISFDFFPPCSFLYTSDVPAFNSNNIGHFIAMKKSVGAVPLQGVNVSPLACLSGSSDPVCIEAQHMLYPQLKRLMVYVRITNVTTLKLRNFSFHINHTGNLRYSVQLAQIAMDVESLAYKESVDWIFTFNLLNLGTTCLYPFVLFEQSETVPASSAEAAEPGGMEVQASTIKLVNNITLDDAPTAANKPAEYKYLPRLNCTPYNMKMLDFLMPLNMSMQEFSDIWSHFSSYHRQSFLLDEVTGTPADLVNLFSSSSFAQVLCRSYRKDHYLQLGFASLTWFEEMLFVTVIAASSSSHWKGIIECRASSPNLVAFFKECCHEWLVASAVSNVYFNDDESAFGLFNCGSLGGPSEQFAPTPLIVNK